MSIGQMKQAIRGRLAPLPKHLEIDGEGVAIDPSHLVIVAQDEDPWTRRAADELAEHVAALAGCRPPIAKPGEAAGPYALRLAAQAGDRLAAAFEDAFFTRSPSPGHQAYRLRLGEDAGGGVVQGLAPEGVYWGMKTLKQLLRFADGRLWLPRARVLDGADLEERGVWTNMFTPDDASTKDLGEAEAHFRAWLDWMSDHKMNLVELLTLTGHGIALRSKRFPEFSVPDAESTQALMQALIPYAARRGIRVVPTVAHTEHFALIARKYPELRAPRTIPHHGHTMQLPINYFDERAVGIMRDLVTEIFEVYAPAGVCFWMSENRMHALADSTESYFMKEAETFLRIAEHVRGTTRPGAELRILLTQGSWPENPALIRALPKSVKWCYYSGERRGTYNIRPINPIPREIAQAAAEGHWISLCNPVVGGIGRPTVMEVLHRNIGHAREAGLQGIDSMSLAYPADRMALFVAAEQAWHTGGRSLNEVFETYALAGGARDPGAQARAYRLYDRANLDQGMMNSTGVGHPFGTFSRFYNMLERIAGNDKVDELMMLTVDRMEEHDLPALDRAITDLEQARGLADAEADALFPLRREYLLHVLRVSRHIAWAFYVTCREKSWDMYKGPWNDFRRELRDAFDGIGAEAEASASSYLALRRKEEWGGEWPVNDESNPLRKTAAFAARIDIAGVTTSLDRC